LVSDSRIPVLVMQDAKGKGSVSLEPMRQEDGDLRLFKEFSGSSFPADSETIGSLNTFLSPMHAKRLIFEDSRKSLLAKLLKKAGYQLVKTYDFQKGAKVSWPSWTGQEPHHAGTRFGTDGDWQLSPDRAFRVMSLSDKNGLAGEMMFSDFGRFARAKANQFGSDGFGSVQKGRSPSSLLVALVGELIKERKRYLILGPEYAEHVAPVHPFPLWHMSSNSQKDYSHGCRQASGTDLKAIAKLVSEYEDIDRSTALKNVATTFYNPSFKFILPPGGGGFSLIKFMDGAMGMINDIYITPASQGKGIGDELTRASLSLLSRSCLNINLNTIYPRAKKLYEKYGFEVVYQDYCVALNQSLMLKQD